MFQWFYQKGLVKTRVTHTNVSKSHTAAAAGSPQQDTSSVCVACTQYHFIEPLGNPARFLPLAAEIMGGLPLKLVLNVV